MNRSRWGWSAACAIAVLALASLAVWGLEGRSQAAREAGEAAPPHRVSTVHGEPVVMLGAAGPKDGIKLEALTNTPHQERLRAYAQVLALEPLADLANRYDNAKAQLDIAEAKLAASRTGFERAQKLYRDRQNISLAQFQSAQAALRVDQAGLKAAQSQLRTLAATAQQSWGPELGAAIVNGSDLLRRLLARQALLVQVTLRPGEAVAQPPTGAFVQLDSGERAPLHFVSAATRTDPRLQGPSFFFTAPADGGLLPGMNVVAFLSAGPAVEGAVLPRSAVVWHAGRAWAYFRIGPGRFARRAVATDRRAPDGGYIVQGLSNGAEVVVEGAQMLLSEEFRAQTRAGGEGDQD